MNMERRFLRRSQVQQLVPVSTSTLYDLMARGEFPRPHKLGSGRAVAWLENEVQEWIATQSRAAA